MVGASKILTVSYGTFSCTLEGFEDPFDTMKAIAEYFRDLAAEDRYFGAEPPQPDAAMLHKIAEREVQRRVEAKVQDNGVILRAEAAPGAPSQALPVARVPTPLPTPPRAVVVDLPEDAQAAAPVLAPASEALSESVAEKLRRLRAASRPEAVSAIAVAAAPMVQAPDATAPAPADPVPGAATPSVAVWDTPPVLDHPAVAEMAEVSKADATLIEPLPTLEFVAEDIPAEEPPVAEPGAEAPETEEHHVEEPVAEAVAAPSQDVEADAVGDRAAAIAAAFAEDEDLAEDTPEVGQADPVDLAMPEATSQPEAQDDFAAMPAAPEDPSPEVSVQDNSAPPAPEAQDPETAGAGALETGEAATSGIDVADAPADEDEALIAALTGATASGSAQPEVVPGPELATGNDDALIAALFGAAPEPEAPAAFEVVEVVEVVEAVDQAEESIDLADAIDPPMTEAGDLPMAGMTEPEPETLPETELSDLAELALETASGPTDEEPAAPETGPAPVDTTPDAGSPVADRLQRARARVIKIRRIEPALTPEAEADLARELAALRGDEADPATAPLPTTRPRDAALARPGLSDAPEDTSVKRLLDATNSQMDEPESRRRLSTIAHLKAAVAATVADRNAGTAPDGQAEQSRLTAYRSDLEQVVRPRRPIPSASAAVTTGVPARPAPLVLVSAQRIDRPAPSEAAAAPVARPAGPVQPVRPRRVGALTPVVTPPNFAADAPVVQARTTDSAMTEDDDLDGDDIDDATDNVFSDQAGFAEFAERLGATELADLLEAAAAYAACVEGRPSVTRPQLIRRVHDVLADAEPSREDVLRSFGRLLRDGRIEKVRRGQFAVREDSLVMAEARKIAG